jgi:hypothetical protein
MESREALLEKLAALEKEFEEETTRLQETIEPAALEIERIEIRPRKADTSSPLVRLVWGDTIPISRETG